MHAPVQCVILISALDVSAPAARLVIDGRPFLDYLLLEAWRFGFRKVLFIVDGGGSRARASLDASRISEETRLVIDVLDAQGAGTGGALHAARDRLDEYFLLLDGQCWFDFNWLSLVTAEAAGTDIATLALREFDSPNRRRPVTIEGPMVRAMGDKPGPGIATAGTYLMSSRILDHVSPVSSLDDVLARLAPQGAVRGHVADGGFIDITDPADRAITGRAVPQWRRRPAVFLDRDGTLNHDAGYVHREEDLRWLPGAANAVRRLNDAGYYVFVVTNQSGVARGMFDEAAVIRLHAFMNDTLRAAGAHIDDLRWCPHHPDAEGAAYRVACRCRKPGPGMILDLTAHWPIAEEASIMIGDKESDAAAGRAAGIAAAIVPPGGLEGFVETLLRRK
jgi:D,D-heptose 1,7-bisphosphate phosphatase